MGDVYRGRDARLKRDVALKVLPDSVSDDPERLARFQREAEVLASLNHPHIAQIYGLEEAADVGGRVTRALVMELVEGPTLEERIAHRAIPPDEACSLAIQMIDALAFAHEHHVIHRDFKPSNVKLTNDGVVKVLDFGLAKALDPLAPSIAAAAQSPTITSPAAMTRAGTFLGTAAYMAPEQARGAVVDKRADIWAFGVVLYEMLTGARLFASETISDTLANVLKSDIDFSALPAETPPSMRRLLRRCLARDRKERLQDIGDARLELADAGTAADVAVGTQPDPLPRGFAWRTAAMSLAAGIALALIGAAVWGAATRNATTTANAPLTFFITPKDGVALDDPPVFAVSPDGQYILLRGTDRGAPVAHLRSLATGDVRRLEATRGLSPVLMWSPDSRAIAFARGNALFRVAIDGLGLETVYGERVTSGAWGASDRMLLTSGSDLRLLDLASKSVTTVAERTSEMTALVTPSWLPSGRGFLVSDLSLAGRVYVGSLDQTSPLQRLVPGVQPAVVPGYLLAVVGTRLLAHPFEADRPEVRGTPLTIREFVRATPGLGGRVFSASLTGVLAIRVDRLEDATRLAWFDRKGVEGGALRLDRHCRNPELAPDGARVAVECYDEGAVSRDIWIHDLARDAATRLTVDPADDADPVWSPDGRRLLFASNRRGPADVFEKSISGTMPETLVFETPGATPTMAWSPDGRHVAVLSTVAGGDLLVFERDGDHHLTSVAASEGAQELEIQWSPDGKFISYSSDESGRHEIYVQPWPQNGERWQISVEGGTDARWNPAGGEILYLSPTRDLMAVSIAVDRAGALRAGTPARLFETNIAGPLGSGHRFPFAISRDGQRLMMYVSDERVSPSIQVIVNWPALVERSAQEPR